MVEWFSEFVNKVFAPLLQKIFYPTNKVFSLIPEGAAPYVMKAFAVGLFVATMVWVLSLRREYVNLDAPGKSVIYDLRVWTVLSMLPHIIVYLWF